MAARRALKEIKPQDVREIMSLNNPPEAVKLTLDLATVILGEQAPSWAKTRRQAKMLLKNMQQFDPSQLAED